MQLISCHSGRLQRLLGDSLSARKDKSFVTGLEAIDQLAPAENFARGAIHELLSPAETPAPLSFALTLAGAAARLEISNFKSEISNPKSRFSSAIVWSDPRGLLYPPALATAGLDLSRLFILKPSNRAEELWALAEALRCRGVGAVVASVGKLSRIEAR